MISILWKEIASLNISKNQNQYKTNYSKLGQQFIAGFYPNHTTSFYYFGVVSTWIIWAIVGPQTTTFSLTTQNTRIAATAVYSHTEGRRLHSRIIFLVTLPCNNIWSSDHQHSSSIKLQDLPSTLKSNVEMLQCTTGVNKKTPDALCAFYFWSKPDKTVIEEYCLYDAQYWFCFWQHGWKVVTVSSDRVCGSPSTPFPSTWWWCTSTN